MVIFLLLIAFGSFAYAFVLVIKACIKLVKAVFYIIFANEKQIDEGYKKHLIKESEECKEFEGKFDKGINDLINPRTFRI